MSGLTFLADYNSDSETEPEINTERAKLPAPDLSKVSVVAAETHKDDPLQHGGRSRSFPHVRGNWATFVYVKYPDEDYLLQLTKKLEEVVNNQDKSWQRCRDIHISLSKTFTLPYHLITPLTNNLQKAVIDTESFELEFSGVKVYCNEENTTTFLALTVNHYCNRYLIRLTKKIDKILSDYKLPKFYEDPSFHMSIFWINGDKRSEFTNLLNDLDILICNTENKNTDLVDKVYCKSGNKLFQYHLL